MTTGHRTRRWSRVRARLGSARAQRGYLPLLRRPHQLVGYVGWAGRANVGDDAMLEAHRTLLPSLSFAPLPNLGPTAAFRLTGRATGGRPLRAVCLGGGTLIGNGHFRRTLETALAIQPNAPRFMLGCGVESEEFEIGNRRDIRGELDRWVELLDGFDVVRVRGPRSAASLAALGVEAVIVGDPALALGPAAPTGVTQERLLGLNVGVADDRWGDESGLVEAVVGLARTYVGRGWTIRLLPASADDRELNERVAARIGQGVEIAAGTLRPRGFLDAAAPCTVLVGEKLHSVVLGAAVHVPGVALEYRPKCRDFQESIGRDRFVVRTDRLEHDEIVGLVDEIVDDRDRQVDALVEAVAHRRALLRQACTDIRATVDA